jgi:hypothetical protein
MSATKATATQQGVEEAFYYWLEQHPVSMGEILTDAIEKAFDSFLRKHQEEILDRIVEKGALDSTLTALHRLEKCSKGQLSGLRFRSLLAPILCVSRQFLTTTTPSTPSHSQTSQTLRKSGVDRRRSRHGRAQIFIC